ncbi:hypothetical protein CTI12_AA386170 [Artemisia annua]|uniref:Helitron helicase-like domain-containing protein n=1 Tax=Artemisia annua TaxID=35608 RepID=A0A2U1MFN9_ARTAN|nr:hypothetical protein CTI12_AA386170 [Artemisia annua]
MDENNERLSRKRKTDVPSKKKPQASNQRLPLSETVTASSNTRVSLAELLTYDPLTGTLPTSHLSNTSSTQQEKLKGSFAQTKRRPRNVLPLADVTNYFPQSLNAVSNLVNSSTDSTSAFCQVSQRSVVCNTINNGNLGSFSPNSLPTSCNKPASVPATRKRQSPLDHISNGPVSIMPQQPKNVSTTPSSNMCNRAMTSGGSILTQTRVPIKIVNNVHRSSATRNTVVAHTTQSTPDGATRHRQSPMTNVSNVSFQTPESHKVNQRTNNTSTSVVQRTIPSIITQNSSYEVGESSRRTKRSKRPSLQAPTPVRFYLNDDDGNVRKVYDKYVGISEGRVSIIPQQPITYATPSSDIGVILSSNSRNSIGRVSIMPQQPITYATPSSDIGVILSSNSGNSIVSQRSVVCNTINNGNLGSFSPNSLPTSCNKPASVPATRKRQSPLDHISNGPVSITPQQPKTVSTTPSSNMCNRAMTSGGSICKNEYTAAFNCSSSSGPSNSKHPIDRNIINEVRAVLDTSSELVQTFRRARDRYTEDTEQNIKIKLIAKRGKDGRNYNLPTANEVAGLIVGDFDSCAEQRDIIIDKRGEGLQRINIFHPMYLPLQYPLLMPRAQDGYHLNIPLRKTGKQTATNQRTTDKKEKNDKTVTMRQWFSYHIMDRPNQENLFTHGGCLFQQFLVDGYTMVETERLYFHRSKQSKLRCDTYSNIRQSIASGNTDPTTLGKPLLRSRGTTLRHWPEMPYPDDTYITDFGNRLIHEETYYNPVELQSEYERI